MQNEAVSFPNQASPVSEKPALSVLVAAGEVAHLAEVLAGYRPALDGLAIPYEVICMTDGRDATLLERLAPLAEAWPELNVIGQIPWSDDDAALATAVRRAEGKRILTLPGWPEVDDAAFGTLLAKLDDGSDLVVAERNDRAKAGWQGFRQRFFSGMLQRLFGTRLADPFCRVRAADKAVLEDVGAFGVRQHFIPIIAAQRGHSVAGVAVPSSQANATLGKYVFRPAGHIRAALDALALYVVLKFLRRPLRFFGAIGLPLVVIGAAVTLMLVGYRIFGDTALSNRPSLIFSVLTLILGIQIIAIGLVGEIIIFSNSRRMKQYEVKSVTRGGTAELRPVDEQASKE